MTRLHVVLSSLLHRKCSDVTACSHHAFLSQSVSQTTQDLGICRFSHTDPSDTVQKESEMMHGADNKQAVDLEGTLLHAD